MKKTSARPDSYVRAPDFAERISGLQLPPEVWAVFARCDSPRSPDQIARLCGLDEDAVLAALRRLARRKLVQKHRLDWQAYLAAHGDAPAPAPAPVAAAPLAPEPPRRPAVPASPPPEASAPPPPAYDHDRPLLLVLANASAAVGRRVEARRELRFQVGKTFAPPIAA